MFLFVFFMGEQRQVTDCDSEGLGETDLAEFVFEKEDIVKTKSLFIGLLSFLFFFFFNIMLTWKIMGASKVSVFYIYRLICTFNHESLI